MEEIELDELLEVLKCIFRPYGPLQSESVAHFDRNTQ